MTSPIRPDGPVVTPLERGQLKIEAPEQDVPSFGDVLKRAIGDAGDLQSNAKEMIGAFLRGEPVELHQVMAASEEAAISLELLVEIRNKLTDAYRSVMNVS
jgi:flagellar hook-basal body complex protein FliE